MKFNWPLIGHEGVLHFLQTAIGNDTLTHAYCFVGPEGVGKTTVANYFVNSILCHQLHGEQDIVIPCGTCIHCLQMKKGVHPDVFRIQRPSGKENISIDAVRECIGRLGVTSFLKSYKIAIIEGAQWLSLEAANALLKILEEPHPSTIIILLAKDRNTLPATIISRVQTIPFRLQTKECITKAMLASGEIISRARFLASCAMGRPGLALRLSDKEKSKEAEEKVEAFFKFWSAPLYERFRLSTEYETQEEALETLKVWTVLMRDCLMVLMGTREIMMYSSFEEKFQALSNNLSQERMMKMFELVGATEQLLRAHVSPRAAFEHFALEI